MSKTTHSAELVLAPMQGVVDEQMRALLTSVGGYDRCVTEFVRVTDHRVPEKVFFRFCPELLSDGVTGSGVPVYVQLLGGNEQAMAQSAACVAGLGVKGIDINFGCPAKIVNRHDGGSVLLKTPERVAGIVGAVRGMVPSHIPVTAKIRLGFDDDAVLGKIIEQVGQTGANALCVHARTRVQGYRPPAHWHKLAEHLPHPLPILINGDIWNPEDARLARHESGCQSIMLGRGAIAFPDLARSIKASWSNQIYQPMGWSEISELVLAQFVNTPTHRSKYVGNRTKQWLSYLSRHYPQAFTLFQKIKRSRSPGEIEALITGSRDGFDADAA